MKQKVILIDIIDPATKSSQALKRMIESENLVNTYGGFVIIKKFQKRQVPDYQLYIGKGKLEEIKSDAINAGVKLIIINNILKPKQLFNIEWSLKNDGIKIWTRVDLILKIFEKHASTSESRLQIELAAIKHMGPRIFGMGMELSRQAGGIGTRGIGETNTEIMKRHLASQEKKIKQKLSKIGKRHELHRKNRERKNLKTIAIVGYTNAGKSQLLRSLTNKNVKVRDELFATLETKIGNLYLPGSQNICLVSDTIGFIQDLPPGLIEAFKATLDETIHAELLLHVVDFSDKDRDKKIKVVSDILKELGVGDKPSLMVCNKIDLIKSLKTKSFDSKHKKLSPTYVSALDRVGLDELVKKIEYEIK